MLSLIRGRVRSATGVSSQLAALFSTDVLADATSGSAAAASSADQARESSGIDTSTSAPPDAQISASPRAYVRSQSWPSLIRRWSELAALLRLAPPPDRLTGAPALQNLSECLRRR